jgi:hypothetical protein
MTPGRRLLQIWPLLAAAAAATAVHLLLLRYELRTLGEWIRMWRAPGETAAVFPDAVLRLLILHAIINAASGLLYAGLARPLKADVAWMAGGGMAALIPNTICTFAGAVLLIPSLRHGQPCSALARSRAPSRPRRQADGCGYRLHLFQLRRV